MAFKCVIIVASIITATSLEPIEEGLDWEDFEAALKDDGAEDAISLLQTKVSVKKSALAGKMVSTPQDSLKPAETAEETGKASDLSMDAFADTLQAEEMAPEAVSLVQTDAHIERKATPTQADQQPKSQDGMMHLSVGADGSIHSEDQSLFLLQTDAQTNRVTVVTEADGTNVVVGGNPERHAAAIDQDDFQGEDASAGVSLLQVALQGPSDTTVEKAKRPTVPASDVKIADDLSLMQVEVTPARVEVRADAHKSAEKLDNVFDTVMDVAADGEKSPEALSLLQTDAHIESKPMAIITEADGSNVELSDEMRKLPQSADGQMHISVGADGSFHWEM